MKNRESLYHKHPDYRVDVEANPGRIRAALGHTVIADSSRALIVRETNLDPVIYFPRPDVELGLAEKTELRTFCPFKGEASYWTFRCGDSVAENVAWSYETPFHQVARLKDYVSFYSARVELASGS
jgi:uncharacterized protein (DUF427 family)